MSDLVGAAARAARSTSICFANTIPARESCKRQRLNTSFYEWADERCHLWFFDGGLPGYSYVPKADGYLNCGIGGMADTLKARGEDIKKHWQHFAGVLGKQKFVEGFDFAPKGYSYYRAATSSVRIDNAFITGDAAGLATRDLCEGIGQLFAAASVPRARLQTANSIHWKIWLICPSHSGALVARVHAVKRGKRDACEPAKAAARRERVKRQTEATDRS